MIKKGLFKKPKNKLEGADNSANGAKEVKGDICKSCPFCKKMQFTAELEENLYVCPSCSHHMRIGARQRINYIADSGSFKELFSNIMPCNVLNFPGYDEKLAAAAKDSGEQEAVICGECTVSGIRTCVFAMEPAFMMGSMGSAAGEKITSIFEYALQNRLPVTGFSVSGGARMQEGIISLMQMAKTSGAVKRHSDGKNLYISVLTDPTTGGVTASFAMEGDIIISEPQALICFAGPRVIEQTIRQKLPAGFQKAEFLLEKGFIDMICDRRSVKAELAKILSMHQVTAEGI